MIPICEHIVPKIMKIQLVSTIFTILSSLNNRNKLDPIKTKATQTSPIKVPIIAEVSLKGLAQIRKPTNNNENEIFANTCTSG